MSDEEMAAEYVDTLLKKDDPDLAGLEAGRDMNVPTQWHDLRENSRLVPDDDRDVINENGFIVHYNAEKQRWFSKGNGLSVSVDVTAWCDIPTYHIKRS